MLIVSSQNNRKCEICPGGNYSEEKDRWEFNGEEFSGSEGSLSRGELFRGNCSGVAVFGGIIQG